MQRLLILLTACLVWASAAWADDVGYVDCSSHPENTQVFAKARQTPDVVAAVPCGERFTILVYGFVFSRIQTRDGKVGYVYSNLITVDRGAGPVLQQASARVSAAPAPAPAAPAHPPAVANAVTVAPAYAQPTSASQADSLPVTTSLPKAKTETAQAGPLFPTPPTQPASSPQEMGSVSAQAPVANQAVPTASASVSQKAAPAAIQPVAAPPAPAEVASAPPTPAPAPAPGPAASPGPTAPAASQPASALPSAAQVQAATSAPATTPVSSAPDSAPTPAPVPEPAPAAAAPSQPQPEPEAAPPAPAPVRSASVRSSWEKPLPAGRQNFLLELYSGYAFARFTSAGTSTNLNGAMGSFGYNFKPWLQIVGDTSYNFVTISGTKSVLYGNHFGGRFFYRRGSRWGFTPFVEALVGGSRLDTSISGVGGYSTSTNCISYKAGGGIDVRVKRHWEIRVIDFDYYRTAFGTNATQNNYWASAGVILRLFGAPGE